MMTEQGFQAPDLLRPLHAYRFWTLKITPVTRRVRLWSQLALQRAWEERVPYTAQCVYHGMCRDDFALDHTHDIKDVPALPPANCGIYGYKTAEEALLDLGGKLSAGDKRSMMGFLRGGVLGEVKLWGIVQRHKHGFRAQFAYPASLVMGICDNCGDSLPLGSMHCFITTIDPLARFSVPVVVQCSRHKNRGMQEIPNGLRNLAKQYGIIVGESALVL
jgi:hypothetical protein